MAASKTIFTIFISTCAFFSNAQHISPAELVNPLMGTQSSYSLSTGNTYPSVSLPWGMNAWSAQTGKNGDGWMYSYNADKRQYAKWREDKLYLFMC
jgi:putative alpha-1,2-mannosidase